MTCLVGLVDGGRVWIGADSAGCSGCLLTPRAPEVAKLGRRSVTSDVDATSDAGDMLIGYSGEVRPGQVALHVLEIPAHPDGLPTIDYLICHFVPAFRAALEASGFPVSWHPDNASGPGWTLVVGYRGVLASVEQDFQVNISARPYNAYGCGREFALGSLHTTQGFGSSFQPQNRVRLALGAAADLDLFVSDPFILLEV